MYRLILKLFSDILSIMFDEDGRKINIRSFPANLEPLSVQELQEYIQELQDEITKVEAEISKKKASQDAAAALFGN